MDSKLFLHVRTTEEREKLLEELEALLASLYEESGRGFDSALKNKVRYWVSEIVRTEVKAESSEIKKYLSDLKKTLESLEVVKLTLAFEPSDITIDRLTGYIKRNTEDSVVIEFEYDPRILGGALITYKGEYRDFSLKRLFEEEYKEKQGEVMKIMYSK